MLVVELGDIEVVDTAVEEDMAEKIGTIIDMIEMIDMNTEIINMNSGRTEMKIDQDMMAEEAVQEIITA